MSALHVSSERRAGLSQDDRHSRRTSLLQRQAGLRPFKHLDLTFLVDTQYQGSARQVHGEPDHIGHFLLELRVIRYLEPICGFEAGLGADALHARVADPIAVASKALKNMLLAS